MVQRERVRTAVEAVVSPIQEFIRTESSSGIVLIAAALVAFGWANSPWTADYFAILELEAGLRVGEWALHKPLLLWVNDLLMAVFFFLVGLEIKRELAVGELKSRRRATLPIAGALGGMAIPALIFVALNLGTPAVRGWGVPMATDIAFALGVLALLGDRVSLSLKVFLLALAIVDDLGAVAVIALFYTASVDFGSLALAAVTWGVVFAYGRFGAARPLVYVVLGAVMWYFMLKSGVHATVAGVLLALTVPLRHRLSAEEIRQEVQRLVDGERGGFEETEVAIENLEDLIDQAHSPLHNMEHALGPIVAFVIMPVFAFFNAGVALGGGDGDTLAAVVAALTGPVSLGVFFGLLIGKPVGIVLFAWLAVRMGLTELPGDARWSSLVGVGILAGIGFTMSLFIANLAFVQEDLLADAKVAVLAASVTAAVIGLAILALALRRDRVDGAGAAAPGAAGSS